MDWTQGGSPPSRHHDSPAFPPFPKEILVSCLSTPVRTVVLNSGSRDLYWAGKKRLMKKQWRAQLCGLRFLLVARN